MLKGKDPYAFVRFGGLDLKNQKGFNSPKDRSGYHAPPTTRGFYAMPKILQEFFLIGSLSKTQPEIFPKCPEWHENETDVDKEFRVNWDWVTHRKRCDKVYKNIRKEFRKDKGYVWHHLKDETPINEVISRHNSWIKTSIKVWAKALQKEVLGNRYGSDIFTTNTVNNARFNGCYSKDHFEVFFDEKV